jgi:uncharacterized membrane protein
MPTDPNDPPPPEYRTPGGDGADTAWLTLSFIGGLIASGAVAAVVSWIGARLLFGGLGGDAGGNLLVMMPIILFVAAAAAVVTFVLRVRIGRQMTPEARRRRGRFFLLGFLLGIGLIWLLQGICFVAISRMQVD